MSRSVSDRGAIPRTYIGAVLDGVCSEPSKGDMTAHHPDLEDRRLDLRSHLLATIPLLALVAATAWLVVTRPSAQADAHVSTQPTSAVETR